MVLLYRAARDRVCKRLAFTCDAGTPQPNSPSQAPQKGGQVDRALFYAVVIGGSYALCMLILLDNSPLAIAAGALVGVLALLRGMAVWG